MKQTTKTRLIGLLLVIGLSAILKFYFKTPNIAILFLIVLGTISGLANVLVRGYVNPPSWLYRIRSTFMGVFYGIFIGVLLFGKDTIEKSTFNIHDLLEYIVIGSVIGVVFKNFEMFSQSQKLKRRKGLFLPERQLVKDSALLIKQNGEKIKGKLVLTNDHLIFLGNGKEEKNLEKEVCEIYPNVSKTKFLGIPDGFRIENDDILLKVSFPYYWLKSINNIKTTA
jgi:hypothetical protein